MSNGRASIGTSKRLAVIAAFVILVLGGAWLTARWIADGDDTGTAVANQVAAATQSGPAPSTTTSTTSTTTSTSSSTSPSTTASPAPTVTPTTTTPPQAHVLFASNSSILSSTAKADLSKVAAFVKTSRTAFVVIQGHSDSKGSAAAKQRTAMARAHVVEDYLMDLGVPRAQLSHTSLSDTAPAAADSAQNRRVDVVVKDVG